MVAETDVDTATALRDQTEQAETEDSPVSSAALDKSRQDSVIQPRSGTGTTTSGDTANERVPSMPSLETATDLDIAADKTEQDVQTTETALPAKATTIASMDVDTDPTQPRWSDHEDDEEETGVLLPQPETFAGRSTKTGYVYDVRMRFHNNVHGDDDHPEDPRRIWRIFDALNTAQCTDRMIKIPSREATFEELNLVHTESHIENITKTTVMSKDNLLEMANGYNSIYLNNSSAFCARLSCGSLIELCKAVALGQVLNGLAIIRPPGHHAEPDEAGGFCLYNNVAIAARYLQQAHGLKKIFILDWDVHHGNGTQTAFYDDPDVLYCSIHRYDYGTFYPGDPIAAAHTAIGEGRGRGRTINIPWNTHGMGDSEYIYAFNKVIMPVLYEFAPDFVLVSAGFDAAKGDHIGQMLVTPPAYGHMTQMLRSLAGGKIILALEGGYNLDSIAVSGLACARALLNDPIDPLGPIVPNMQCVQTIHEVMEVQSRYWKSLPQVYIDQVEEQVEGRVTTSMTKIQEVYRQTCLREKHGMIKMPKLEGEQENEFLDNVYCTGEFYTKTLSNSNVIRPDKSVLVDTVSQYVDHIVESENELIDVVVPYQPGSEDDKVALKDSISTLLAEIWDNYVSTTGYMGRRIILLATGFGCHGLVAFMNERQKEVVKHVSCVTLVPGDDSLPMVTKKLGPWYMENSFVVLTADHPVWERAQKSNNRTGNLVRAEQPAGRLSELLNSLRHSIFNDIDAKLESLPPVVAGDDSDLDFQDDLSMETDVVAAPNKDSDDEPSEKSNGDVKAAGTPPAELHPLTSPTVHIRDEGSRPKQTLSHPGSPLQSGSTIPRPIVSPLVDRPTVVGQQHRLQPYPAPGGRSQNSATAVTAPGSAYAHGSAPLSRGPDSRPPVEVHDSRPWPMAANSPQQHPAVHADEQRQQPIEHHPSVLRQQPGRQDGPTHPYQGGERRVARTAGPREYYPTPSTS
ncbi:Histone deacetylase hda1, partial [Dissophora globulifera]